MQIVKEFPPGMPSWVDLATSDAAGAKRFYNGLLGWSYDDRPIPDGSVYSLAQLAGHDVAAVFAASAEQGPPHWNSYVTVADVEAASAKAQSLGAKLIMAPFDVMDSGRMSVIAAPDGSVLSLWQPLTHIGAQLVNQPGAYCWAELNSRDLDAAKAFYSALFGWELHSGDGPNGEYISILLEGRQIGGMMALPPEASDAPSNWMVYFTVRDCDAALAKVSELGGSAHMGPFDVPEVGRMAIVADPQGAVFSIIALDQIDPPPGY